MQAYDVDDDNEEGEEEGEEKLELWQGMAEDDISMRLYLDTADVLEWSKWADTGLFYGGPQGGVGSLFFHFSACKVCIC